MSFELNAPRPIFKKYNNPIGKLASNLSSNLESTTIKSSSLSSSDNFVSKKINDISSNGMNPFGNKTEQNIENNQPNGIIAKTYLNVSTKIDQNRDGFLSKKELVNAMNNKEIKGKDSALVGALLEKQSNIQRMSDDETGIENKGITKKDILSLDKSEGSLKENINETFYYSLSKTTYSSNIYDKDGSLKLPQKVSDINIKDLQQGAAGDCYFLAALAGLAQRRPEHVLNMIQDNKDGTYNIKFGNTSVKIDAPTQSELGMYAEGKAWVPIIEKAYAHYRQDTDMITKVNPWDHSGKGSRLTGRAIKDITGNSFDTDPLSVINQKSTKTKLENAFKNNKLVVASISKEIIPGTKNKFELPDAHVYTVMDYDSKSDKVKIRNPWGNGEAQKNGSPIDGNDDGIFELSLKDFSDAFSMIAYEK